MTNETMEDARPYHWAVIIHRLTRERDEARAEVDRLKRVIAELELRAGVGP